MEVKEIKQISAIYQMVLEEDGEDEEDKTNETFEFEIIFNRNEWVLQGDNKREGVGTKYSQSELNAILKLLKEKNLDEEKRQKTK